MKITVSSLKDLLETVDFFINGFGVHYLYDIIVVDGSECVGKSTLINILKERLDLNTYRPDYNFWEEMYLPKDYRWCIFMSLLDMSSSGSIDTRVPLLVDRGMFSGIVYNFKEIKDWALNKYTEKVLESKLKILHIVVTPKDYDTYKAMIDSRNPDISDSERHDYLEIDKDFRELVNMSDSLDVITYVVSLEDKEYSDDTCESCGHFFSGLCLNKNSSLYKTIVRGNHRCDHTYDKEVQDV